MKVVGSPGTFGGGGSITYNGWYSVTGVYTPSYGEAVDKMGRTTGWTRGTFLYGCAAVGLDFL